MDKYDNLGNKNILKELLDYFEENYLEFTEGGSKIFNWFEMRMKDNLIINIILAIIFRRNGCKNKEKGIKLIKETENLENKNLKFI